MVEHDGFEKGQRVAVYNPDPTGQEGVVLEDCGPYSRHVHVAWDDGTTGWPQGRLIRALTTASEGERL